MPTNESYDMYHTPEGLGGIRLTEPGVKPDMLHRLVGVNGEADGETGVSTNAALGSIYHRLTEPTEEAGGANAAVNSKPVSV